MPSGWIWTGSYDAGGGDATSSPRIELKAVALLTGEIADIAVLFDPIGQLLEAEVEAGPLNQLPTNSGRLGAVIVGMELGIQNVTRRER